MSTQAQVPATQQPTAVVAKPTEKDITGQVMLKIQAFTESGELQLPKDYSVGNALKSAWILIQETKDRSDKPALEVCTQTSIANALLKMIVWGLSPLKKQCDFIVYGDKLQCDPEYTGNLALAKRYGGLVDYNAQPIFKGDVFEFERESKFPYRKKITKHTTTLDSIGGEVIGAYFAYETKSFQDVEIMNISQIKAAWGMGGSKGNSPAHTKFSDQMSIKTVINRGCKLLIRASDDSVLYDKEDSDQDQVADGVKTEIKTNANKKDISFDDYSVEPSQQLSEAKPVQQVPSVQQQPEGIKVNGQATQSNQATLDGPGF